MGRTRPARAPRRVAPILLQPTGMEPDRICPERVRLLRFAKDVMNQHSRLVVVLRDVAVAGCPEIFKAFMEEVNLSSGRVKQAFKAYTGHLDSHGCDLAQGAPDKAVWFIRPVARAS